LEPLTKALPAGSRVCEFEVFDHFAFAIDDHDGVFLTGESPGRQKPGRLTIQRMGALALRGSWVDVASLALEVVWPCRPSN
jgi:hypothetical protein